MAETLSLLAALTGAERIDRARKIVESLGGDARSIARRLQSLDAKGEPGKACRCVLTQYLKRCGFAHAEVSWCEIGIGRNTPHAKGRGYVERDIELSTLRNGVALRGFLIDFDRGLYPWLESKAA